MRLMRSAPPLLVMMMALTIGPSLEVADMVFFVSYEGSKDYIINVTFVWSKFKQFYRCLCAGETTSCSAKYKESSEHPVLDISQQSDQNQSPGCGLFQCFNSGQLTSLTCRRLNLQPPSCAGGTRSSFISLQDISSCDLQCVGVNWALTQEKLVINNPHPEAQICEGQCCSTTSTSVPNLTSLPGNIQSTETYVSSTRMDEQQQNVSEWRTSHTGTLYTETIIVSGVAAGIVFVALIVFLVIIFLKRKAGHSSTRKGNNTESLALPGDVGDGRTTGAKKTPKQGLDKNTINDKGLTNWAAMLGHNGGPAGQSRQGRGFEPHKSVGKSTQPAAHTNSGVPSSSEDPDYAVIEEAQMQPDGRYYSNNISSGCTDPSSSDHDGYSSLDNLDYYNIVETVTALETGHSNPDDGDQNSWQQISPQFQESRSPRSRQVSPLTSHANQPSEYSVARSINDVTTRGAAGDGQETSADTTRGAAGDGQETSADTTRGAAGDGQETSADTTRGAADPGEPPHRLTLRSLNQLAQPTGDQVVGGHKRNTYFELTREGDYDD